MEEKYILKQTAEEVQQAIEAASRTATTDLSGLMSSEDKAKLDALPDGGDYVSTEDLEDLSDAMKARITGRSDESDAYTDPFVWLGEFNSATHGADYLKKFNAALDALCGTAAEDTPGRKWTGRVRATVSGGNVEIFQYAQNFKSRAFTQTIAGNVAPASDGSVRVLAAGNYNILTRACNAGTWTAWTEAHAGKDECVHDLGVVADSTAAFNAAAQQLVVNNPKIREIRWRTSDSTADGGRGDGGSIYQVRRGNWFVVQWMMFEGAARVSKVRCITTGGNHTVGEWQNLITPTDMDYNATTRAVTALSPNGTKDFPARQTRTLFTLPLATAVTSGMMAAADKSKLDALPAAERLADTIGTKVDKVPGKGLSSYDFDRDWLNRLANAGLYGRSNGSQQCAVNGVFALAAGATDDEIKAALTEYATKHVLTRADMEYCAANACQLWDEQTQAFVTVTHNGGGMFNLLELSQANFGELPKLRIVGLRAMDDGTWRVTRPGQAQRLAYKPEVDAVEATAPLRFASANRGVLNLTPESSEADIRAVFGGAADLSEVYAAVRSSVRPLVFLERGSGSGTMASPVQTEVGALTDGGHSLDMLFVTDAGTKRIRVVCDGSGAWRVE